MGISGDASHCDYAEVNCRQGEEFATFFLNREEWPVTNHAQKCFVNDDIEILDAVSFLEDADTSTSFVTKDE